MSADIVPLRSKSRAPVTAPPRARVTVVDVTGFGPVEYVVSIDYFEAGDTVWAGAFFDYSGALDHARQRGNALGISVVDFTGIALEDGGDAA